MARELDEATARARVAALALSDAGERRRVICGLVGHSRVVDDAGDGPIWHVSCARCGQRVDLDRRFDAHAAVFRRHVEVGNCEICMGNCAHLTWQDRWEVELGQTEGRG